MTEARRPLTGIPLPLPDTLKPPIVRRMTKMGLGARAGSAVVRVDEVGLTAVALASSFAGGALPSIVVSAAELVRAPQKSRQEV